MQTLKIQEKKVKTQQDSSALWDCKIGIVLWIGSDTLKL